jgi:hypothetical protein
MAQGKAHPSALPQGSSKEFSYNTLHDNVRAHFGDSYTYLQQGKREHLNR